MKQSYIARGLGFTLIEVLVVVAIISLLSAIAVVNMQLAQIRASVSRAKNDLRVLATRLETYAVDHNRYPPSDLVTYNEDLNDRDAFQQGHQAPSSTAYLYGYILQDLADCYSLAYIDHVHGTTITEELRFKWVAFSVGPDRNRYNNGELYDPLGMVDWDAPGCVSYGGYLTLPQYENYDPTNGTISYGNIFRTDLDPEKIPVHPFLTQKLEGCTLIVCNE